jgi:branched-chain amino acid transport system permease protein
VTDSAPRPRADPETSASAGISGVGAALSGGLRDLRAAWGPSAWASIAAVGASALLPLVASAEGVRFVAAALYLGVAAVGLNFAVGLAGLPVLSQGAFVGIGAFGAAWLEVHKGWHAGPAIAASLIMCVAAGFVVGTGAIRLRRELVAVATWIVAWLLWFTLLAFPHLSGGSQGLVLPDARIRVPLLGATLRLTAGVHFEIALAVLALAVFAFLVVSRSPTGLHLAAVREGPAPAAAVGVAGGALQVGSFTAAAGLGGLAGALGVHLAGVADRVAYGPLLSFELFVAVLLGGAGSVLGPLWGTAVVVLIPGAVRGVGSISGGFGGEQYAPVITSALLLVALAARSATSPLPRRRAGGGNRAEVEAAGPVLEPARRLSGPVLAAAGIVKRYGGVTALGGVEVAVSGGEIRALVGPNGSGKTTLLRVLAGATAPDEGTVSVGDRDVTGLDVRSRARLGVARTLQRTAGFPLLSASEHVEVGMAVTRRHGGVVRSLLGTPRARAERRQTRRRALAILGRVDIDPTARSTDLSAGEMRLLAVATAAASSPQVLLLDEPSSGMSRPEVERLARLVREMRGRGTAIVMVEHDFPLVAALADRVTVLDAGRVIAEGPPEEVAQDPAVLSAYLGSPEGAA